MLSGKIAIITGAAGGIGRACVDLFCENHAEVYAFVREERPDFAGHISELVNQGAKVHVIECDIGSEASIKEAVRSLTKNTKTVDILVNNAGMSPEISSFQMTSMNKLKHTFEVNFFGHISLTQYISRIMSRNKSGSIVNVASIAGIDGILGNFGYGSSKSAMVGSTRGQALELGEMGIRLNTVAPGVTDTKILKNMSEEVLKNNLNNSIIKRTAEPREIANAILFFASDMSSFVTGQVLRVDGGLHR